MRSVALKEVAEIERDAIAPGVIKSGTKYLGLEHIESGGGILSSDPVDVGDLASTKFRFGADHVLYGKLRPYLAKIALPDFEGVCSTDILPVRPGPDLDKRFLAYFLRQPSMIEFAASRSTGANLPRLSPKALGEFEIPLPPLPEQRRIAAILDQADALRRLRRQSLSRLSELGQAIFRQMFGDLVANDKEFYDGRIGELIAGFDTGKNLAAAASDVISINRVLKVSAVTSGTFDVNESKPLSDNYKPPASHFVHSGDLLFSRANTASLIGATAVVNHPVENIVMPDKLWRFQWHRTSEAMFVHHLFQSVPMRREISRRASGTSGSMKNIAKEKVLSIKLGIPGESSRREFERKVEASDRIHALSASRNADSLFASLQHRAFRGEL